MNAKLTIKNPESTNTVIFNDTNDKTSFFGVFNGEKYSVNINEDYFITLDSKTHKTAVKIRKKGDSNIEIIDNNGSILIPIDVLAIKENNGMISLVYKIDGKENSIIIEFY